MIKIAFVGFRHSHIYGLYNEAKTNSEVELVAACEEDLDARALAEKDHGVQFTHDTFEQMLAQADFDVLAIGDYFGKRGSLAISALKAGKHVLADKPLCISLQELDEIEALSKKTGLKVGCMLDMRYVSWAQTVKKLIQDGVLGVVQSVSFGGQHPLNYGTRPGWYFEEGKHGGTINDIAIHGIDMIEYLTGLYPVKIIGARCWNGFAEFIPNFKDCGQFMVELSNGAGLIADVSYASPNSYGFALPYYWRFNIWGTKGVIEVNYNNKEIRIALNGTQSLETILPEEAPVSNILSDFLCELNGGTPDLNTDVVFKVSRKALEIQAFADNLK